MNNGVRLTKVRDGIMRVGNSSQRIRKPNPDNIKGRFWGREPFSKRNCVECGNCCSAHSDADVGRYAWGVLDNESGAKAMEVLERMTKEGWKPFGGVLRMEEGVWKIFSEYHWPSASPYGEGRPSPSMYANYTCPFLVPQQVEGRCEWHCAIYEYRSDNCREFPFRRAKIDGKNTLMLSKDCLLFANLNGNHIYYSEIEALSKDYPAYSFIIPLFNERVQQGNLVAVVVEGVSVVLREASDALKSEFRGNILFPVGNLSISGIGYVEVEGGRARK